MSRIVFTVHGISQTMSNQLRRFQFRQVIVCSFDPLVQPLLTARYSLTQWGQSNLAIRIDEEKAKALKHRFPVAR